ncbi:MAG: CdvA-like protein [Crenarchaeota archaeon]|nr:CdvA-like protein [Thermoproteota archaeon]MDA0854076.1 CdvA-like protein [Thermoproteota archaeon]MDA1122795.1 CdvA-like protein [Thermoproteota archaeon]HJJ22053.1 CdvA-like protein [Nitrosopumilus sp.]HJJ26418.1 CdvA-like protein [Nitrosopumilus sp.]
MTNDNIEIIGKNVKDMYGTFMGKVVGTVTDIDGSIQSVGIDCGTQGLQQIQYEQLVVQGETVIFIPKWRLDSQRLIRQKQLTLRRLKALMDIVSENDSMKEDAEIIHEKYHSKLASLDEMESEIKSKLVGRLIELDAQMRSAKMLWFDAKVQFKSSEISEATFETVKSCTTEVIEHVTHEQSEISNVQKRIADLELEEQKITTPAEVIQESPVSYLDTTQQQQVVQTILPEVPTKSSVIHTESIETYGAPIPEFRSETEVICAFPEPPQQVTSKTSTPHDDDWLARMEAQ